MKTIARLKPTDALSVMHLELCRDALRLQWFDGDLRQSWIDAARQLLQAVPDPWQRFAWQMTLAQSFAVHIPDASIACVMGQLSEKEF